MKKRRLVRIGILLVSGCAGVLIVPASRYALVDWLRNEPCYDHMPVSYWKDQMRAWISKESKPPPRKPRVLDGGKEAVPVLIELVKEKDLWVRTLAIRSLARIGPEARDAVPALITVLSDNRGIDPFDEPGTVLGYPRPRLGVLARLPGGRHGPWGDRPGCNRGRARPDQVTADGS